MMIPLLWKEWRTETKLMSFPKDRRPTRQTQTLYMQWDFIPRFGTQNAIDWTFRILGIMAHRIDRYRRRPLQANVFVFRGEPFSAQTKGQKHMMCCPRTAAAQEQIYLSKPNGQIISIPYLIHR